ncbi:MAG: alpha/beta fold hydrolase [Alphaproteobacteria bacterium]|nr:alpha/beta fold hydrolase [Alphaproteobacteria bacterium]
MDINLNGATVFAHTGGNPFDPAQPVLVLIHGAGTDHTFWGLQTRYFAHHGYSVLAVDLPGHGRSDGPALGTIDAIADWLWQVLDAVGAKRATLAGHSMGSLIALAAGAKQPENTDALVLVGTAERVAVHEDLLAAAADNDPRAFDMITDWGFGKPSHLGGHQAPGLWMLGGGRALLSAGTEGVLSSDLAACDAYQGAIEAAGEITCPVLFLSGAGDRMTPPKMTKALVDMLDHVESEILPGTGHMIMVERPNETIDVIDGFLRRMRA